MVWRKEIENSKSVPGLCASAPNALDSFVCPFILSGLLYNYMLWNTVQTYANAVMARLHLLYLLALELFSKHTLKNGKRFQLVMQVCTEY